ALAAIAWALVIATASQQVEGGTDLTRVATFGGASTLLISAVVTRELAGARRAPHALTFWGDASYSLYLTHGYVIQAFGVLATRWPAGQRGAAKIGLALACLAACGAVAAICHLTVERPL